MMFKSLERFTVQNARYGIVKKTKLSFWDKVKKFFRLADKWREKGLCATDKIGGWPGGFQYADVKTAIDRSLNMYRVIDTKTRKCFEDHQRMAQEESVAVLNNSSVHVDPYLHMAGLKNSVCGIVIQIALHYRDWESF